MQSRKWPVHNLRHILAYQAVALTFGCNLNPSVEVKLNRFNTSKSTEAPTGLKFDLVEGKSELKLSWPLSTNADLSSFEYEVRNGDCSLGALLKTDIVDKQNSEVLLTDLKVGINYSARIRSIKKSKKVSDWSQCSTGKLNVPSFETSLANLGPDSANIVLEASGIVTNQDFKISAETSGNVLSTKTFSTNGQQIVALTNLSSGTDYNINVSVSAVDSNEILLEAQFDFKTLSAWTAVDPGGFTRSAYTALGAFAKTNHPFVSWVPVFPAGSDDKKYMFSGVTVDTVGTSGHSNNVWRLNALSEWAPLGGALGAVGDLNNSEAVYGTLGVVEFPKKPGHQWQAASFFSNCSGLT